jgi:orotidine-5'-phosphate decarboxylase
MGFFARLRDRIDRVDSHVCIGLDSDPDRLPDAVADAELPQWQFNRRIIDATAEFAAAYKPNMAFYETPDGLTALTETIGYAHAQGVPVILDAKRGDIGNTARAYARLLDAADAITVNPYMGTDSVAPFLNRTDKGVYVLCRTSNSGATDLQDRLLADGQPVYAAVAALADGWATADNVGLVVGATAPAELELVRETAPDRPLLLPGVGAQGGDLQAVVTGGFGTGAELINSSRSIIFADPTGGPQFAEAARGAARKLRDAIRRLQAES